MSLGDRRKTHKGLCRLKAFKVAQLKDQVELPWVKWTALVYPKKMGPETNSTRFSQDDLLIYRHDARHHQTTRFMARTWTMGKWITHPPALHAFFILLTKSSFCLSPVPTVTICHRAYSINSRHKTDLLPGYFNRFSSLANFGKHLH